GDISISYYVGDATESISNLKAIIHNPDGSKFKLSNKDFFEEKVNENWKKTNFTFPNIQEGSVIEYTYKLHSKGVFTLPEWYFQHDIPTVWSEYNLGIPKLYQYVRLAQGNFDIDESSWEKRNYNYRYDQSTGIGTRSANGTLSEDVLEYHIVKKDVPAMKEEAYITTMDDYLARVRFQLSGTEFNQVYKPVLKDWKATAEAVMEANYIGTQIKTARYSNALYKEIENKLNGITDPLQQLAVVYNYINTSIEWDGSYSQGSSEGLDKCFKVKKASSGELNLMVLAVLKRLNIEAYPLMVSTRGHGKMFELYPIMSQFNHTMAYAVVNGKGYIIDAGNVDRPIGMPRVNALNGVAWMVNPKSPQWININPIEGTSVYLADFTINEEGELKGVIKEMFKGYSAVAQRSGLDYSKCEDQTKEAFAEAFPDSEIENVEIANLVEVTKPLKINCGLTLPEGAVSAGDKVYLAPILMKAFSENPFKAKERLYPVDMSYPISERYILKLQLPEGFTVEQVPEDMSIALPGQDALFTYSVKVLDGFLQVSSYVKFKKTRYESETYAALKNFVDYVIEKQEEQIVLTYEEE
ncbi:MAG: DUF3857 domain-containing protein, partial [Bacteroidota bacterium]